MKEECGEDWVEKINKMREAKHEVSEIAGKKCEDNKFSALAFEDNVWAMEKGKING